MYFLASLFFNSNLCWPEEAHGQSANTGELLRFSSKSCAESMSLDVSDPAVLGSFENLILSFPGVSPELPRLWETAPGDD